MLRTSDWVCKWFTVCYGLNSVPPSPTKSICSSPNLQHEVIRVGPLSSRAGVPLRGTAQRCTGTEERPQEKPTLLTPWSWSSGLQNFEKINLLFEQSSPRYITMAGLANEHVVLMWLFPSLYILPWIFTKHVFPTLPFCNSWTERVLTGLLAKASLNRTPFLTARADDN